MIRRLIALFCLLLLPGLAAAQERVVNVYNWSDYIDPYAVQRFMRETGIRVRYDVYDSLETLEGKLSAGRSGYDIIVPTSEPSFARLLRAGALAPLDRARLPNWRFTYGARWGLALGSIGSGPLRRIWRWMGLMCCSSRKTRRAWRVAALW
jgi:spermidine/putrescine-binding protein